MKEQELRGKGTEDGERRRREKKEEMEASKEEGKDTREKGEEKETRTGRRMKGWMEGEGREEERGIRKSGVTLGIKELLEMGEMSTLEQYKGEYLQYATHLLASSLYDTRALRKVWSFTKSFVTTSLPHWEP